MVFDVGNGPEGKRIRDGNVPAPQPEWDGLHPDLQEVLQQAALLQELVDDAVLVGGSAAALYAQHRASYDHDHVISDLSDRFDVILDALESEGEWVTNRSVPGKIILGRLGQIEAGVRQLIRKRPLETTVYTLPNGTKLMIPTAEETLRVKAYLLVKRNQVRDYLDVAALADRYGLRNSAKVLAQIDDYYTDPRLEGRPLKDQVVRQLLQAAPKDSRTLRRLPDYKGLDARWHSWGAVELVLADLALEVQYV